MNYRINILIYTDDVDEWVETVKKDIHVFKMDKRKEYRQLYSDMFIIRIKNEHNREREWLYSCVVIDKKIDRETMDEFRFLARRNVMHTQKGFELNRSIV